MSKELPIDVWRTPRIDNVPSTLWYADQITLIEKPCPKIQCRCGSDKFKGTLKMGQNWSSCENNHNVATTNPEADNTEEEMKRTYNILGLVIEGGVWRKK